MLWVQEGDKNIYLIQNSNWEIVLMWSKQRIEFLKNFSFFKKDRKYDLSCFSPVAFISNIRSRYSAIYIKFLYYRVPLAWLIVPTSSKHVISVSNWWDSPLNELDRLLTGQQILQRGFRRRNRGRGILNST